MAYADLKDFIEALRSRGELLEIAEEVDAELEISAFADRAVKAGGPALLFNNVRGYDIPVLINAFGSMERMALALEMESLEDGAQEIARLLKPQLPTTLIEKVKALPDLLRLQTLSPKMVPTGICQEVVETDNPSAAKLPIIKCWPHDGGPFITLPLVFTKHPTEGTRNIGMYRMQKYDDRTFGMHWHRHKGGAKHYRVAEELGQRLEVAVALGPDPAVTYAATAPLPDEVDELMLAGFLRKKSVELAKCKTVDLEVPANSQIVLEGYVEPGERRIEGPFGDHQGYYSLPAEYPVFHLTALTHAREPIYPATVVGPPPMEDGYLGKATERLFLPLIRQTLPEIVDMNLPIEGIFHNLAIVSIDKQYPGHAKKVMHALWGLGQMMFTKVIIVVDKDCNVQDMREVIWKVGTHIDPRHDVVFTEGPSDVLDFATRVPDYGTKMGIDATRKWRDEGFEREWPEECVMPDDVKARVEELWRKLGL
jgi:4-hydroxy-3-polyprenylbenzoate decarboxylase